LTRNYGLRSADGLRKAGSALCRDLQNPNDKKFSSKYNSSVIEFIVNLYMYNHGDKDQVYNVMCYIKCIGYT